MSKLSRSCLGSQWWCLLLQTEAVAPCFTPWAAPLSSGFYPIQFHFDADVPQTSCDHSQQAEFAGKHQVLHTYSRGISRLKGISRYEKSVHEQSSEATSCAATRNFLTFRNIVSHTHTHRPAALTACKATGLSSWDVCVSMTSWEATPLRRNTVIRGRKREVATRSSWRAGSSKERLTPLLQHFVLSAPPDVNKPTVSWETL